MYGIAENPKGTAQHIRSENDIKAFTSILSSVRSSISEFSVRDCIRLGKFSENHCRPILVIMSRSNDVLAILGKKRQLSQHPHISIKPDLVPKVRKIESILLKQRRELITSGNDPRVIKIRKHTLLCNGREYGVVVNSTFQKYPLISDLASIPSQSTSQIHTNFPDTYNNAEPSFASPVTSTDSSPGPCTCHLY